MYALETLHSRDAAFQRSFWEEFMRHQRTFSDCEQVQRREFSCFSNMDAKPARSTAEIRLHRFVIEADEAAAMAEEWGVATVAGLLPLLVPATQRLARPHISKYHVGAVGLGSSGRIYLGVNLEFPGLPLHHSIHAEQFLVANAAAQGETAIRCFAVSAAPCGHCRQFLQEIRGAAEIRILVTSDADPAAFRPLSDFLPQPFGPPDLLPEGLPLLLEPHDNEVRLLEPAATGALCNGVEGCMQDRLRRAAEEAARAAHAPYSGCPSGFAMADGEGRVHVGSYAESAAYNPSLGPVQAAIVAYVAARVAAEDDDDRGGWRITAAALVEKEAAAVSHEATARIFLAAVAPRADLGVYRFRSFS